MRQGRLENSKSDYVWKEYRETQSEMTLAQVLSVRAAEERALSIAARYCIVLGGI